jgi:catechol 2,3-dioxygenase-like lactoylglutathione lyase family enzyme
MNIDHIGFGVNDFKKTRDFYAAVLAPLGLKIIGEGEGWAMMGKDKCDIWFGEQADVIKGLHFAFVADTHEQVNDFYELAIQKGATDNGKPGLCPDYGPGYYAAFVIDLNGHNLEVVCRK